jgi:hypothetical protein
MDTNKYERAKKQVELEKGWYTHLFIYLSINIVLQLFYSGIFDNGSITQHFPWWVRLTTPSFWGLSLLVHWIYVFKGARIKNPLKKWEEKKIQQFIEEEEEDFIKFQ